MNKITVLTNIKALFKKTATAASIISLVLLLCATPAFAGGLTFIAGEHFSSMDEKEAVIEIHAQEIAGTEGGQFILVFDSRIVSPVAVEAGPVITDAADSMHMANLEYDEGKLKFMWITAHGDAADAGILCRVIFDLLGEGETIINFAEVIIAPDGFEAVTTEPGKITVTGQEPSTIQEMSTIRNNSFPPVLIGFAALGAVVMLAAFAAVSKIRQAEKKAKH